MLNLFNSFRIIIGVVFIVSGLEKLISPYQNFLYVIQSYELLPPSLELMVAHIFPWIEFLFGLFLFLGLWTEYVIKGVMVMISVFLIVVGQAMIRGLPISECGCFGELISLPLWGVFLFDICLGSASTSILFNTDKAVVLSLDQRFQ